MGTLHPYLQRRGGRFFFRIGVPRALQPIVGARELTRTLRTGERTAAVPLALQLGAAAHRLFAELQTAMSDKDMLKLLADARAKLQVDRIKADLEEQVYEAHQARVDGVQKARLEAQVETLQHALKQALTTRTAAAEGHPLPPPLKATQAASTPLKVLIDSFLDSYPKERRSEMFKKHQAALNLLRDLHGSKVIDQLRQADVMDYFDVVEALPPRWEATCKRLKVTPRQLAAETHPVLLGKKTFDDNYVVPVRLFLKWARLHWQDQGFSTTLTTDGVEFSREDDEGKNKQRAFTQHELTTLFHGPELTGARADPNQQHKWWLPVLAFYSGARINELCQINPQEDLGTSDSGIHFVVVTEDTRTSGFLPVAKISTQSIPVAAKGLAMKRSTAATPFESITTVRAGRFTTIT